MKLLNKTSHQSKHYWLLIALVLLLAACVPIDETPEVPTIDPELPPLAALTARTWLADRLGVPIEQLEIQDMEQAEWSDSCLGLGGPEESCLQVITPGWRIEFLINGEVYTVRTDEDATAIRLEPQDNATDPVNQLLGSFWLLRSFEAPMGSDEERVLPNTRLTLMFDLAKQLEGEGGCNDFSASYQIFDSELTIYDLIRTEIACQPDIMDQEQRYFDALLSAGQFEFTGEDLRIWYGEGENVLSFNRINEE